MDVELINFGNCFRKSQPQPQPLNPTFNINHDSSLSPLCRGVYLEMAYNAEAGSSTASHRMRITSGGSIPNYVQFAQSFLLVNPPIPPIPPS